MSVTVSFSGMEMYDNCPSSFKRRYITKEPVEREAGGTPARLRGTRMHDCIEQHLNGVEGALLPDVMHYRQLFDLMQECGARPEVRWAFDDKWETVDFEADDARVRGILDGIVYHEDDRVVEVYEWKTGKKYPSHEQQRSLYGLAGMLLYPEAEECHTTTVYLDQKKVEVTTLSAGMVAGCKWVWDRRINKTQPPQPYPIRPNWKCRFCDYAIDNGGKCFAGAK